MHFLLWSMVHVSLEEFQIASCIHTSVFGEYPIMADTLMLTASATVALPLNLLDTTPKGAPGAMPCSPGF